MGSVGEATQKQEAPRIHRVGLSAFNTMDSCSAASQPEMKKETAFLSSVEFHERAEMRHCTLGSCPHNDSLQHHATSDKPSVRSHNMSVDFWSSSLHSVTFPPEETIITDDNGAISGPVNQFRSHRLVSESDSGAEGVSNTPFEGTALDAPVEGVPLLRVVWRRGSHLLNPRATTPSIFSNLPARHVGTDLPPVPTARPPPSAGVRRHLRDFPDGISGVRTSPRLTELLLGWAPSLQHEPEAGLMTPSSPLRQGSHDHKGSCLDTAVHSVKCTEHHDVTRNCDAEGESKLSLHQERVVKPSPPQEVSSCGDMPVQLTLVIATTLNHLTTYAVRHQGKRLLMTLPLQTITAPIVSRRITSQCIFLLCTETTEAYVPPGTCVSSGLPVLHEAEARQPGRTASTVRRLLGVCGSSDRDALSVNAGTTFSVEDTIVHNWVAGAERVVPIATVHIAVEPCLLLGNEAGNIFLFSVFKGAVVQRLNFAYSLGSSVAGSAGNALESPRQLVFSTVSCITEVSCDIERRLTSVFRRASLCRLQGGRAFSVSDINAAQSLSSTFAVGFENGHIVLVCVTADGAWMDKHLTAFCDSPVHGISVRVPHLFGRLWHSLGKMRALIFSKPDEDVTICLSQRDAPSAVFSRASELFAAAAERIVALSSGGGVLRLLRIPEMEEVFCTTASESGTAGNFLALQWLPSSSEETLSPNLLASTNEDDCITVYGLMKSADLPYLEQSQCFAVPNRSSSTQTIGRDTPPHVLKSLRYTLEAKSRRSFHRSWVCDLCVLLHPSCNLLIATSYDGRSSIWPVCCGGMSSIAPVRGAADGTSLPDPLSSNFHVEEGATVITKLQQGSSTNLLPRRPAADLVLHSDLATRCIVIGVGASCFVASLSLCGNVKLWEVTWTVV
uniref:Uncharacterized protein n=1 Tax=Trypanosoma vivax (strain Y486) TaxID=1055687 RepID=G0U222_TRYVY|nr:conserved hypothetical protein [Trypanosoma vivax Y486]